MKPAKAKAVTDTLHPQVFSLLLVRVEGLGFRVQGSGFRV